MPCKSERLGQAMAELAAVLDEMGIEHAEVTYWTDHRADNPFTLKLVAADGCTTVNVGGKNPIDLAGLALDRLASCSPDKRTVQVNKEEIKWTPPETPAVPVTVLPPVAGEEKPILQNGTQQWRPWADLSGDERRQIEAQCTTLTGADFVTRDWMRDPEEGDNWISQPAKTPPFWAWDLDPEEQAAIREGVSKIGDLGTDYVSLWWRKEGCLWVGKLPTSEGWKTVYVREPDPALVTPPRRCWENLSTAEQQEILKQCSYSSPGYLCRYSWSKEGTAWQGWSAGMRIEPDSAAMRIEPDSAAKQPAGAAQAPAAVPSAGSPPENAPKGPFRPGVGVSVAASSAVNVEGVRCWLT